MIKKMVSMSGDIEYRMGKWLHRPNGPTRQYNNGTWVWYLFHNRHRYYGPSQSWYGYWFIHGNTIK